MTILIVDGYKIMRETMIRYLELKRLFSRVFEANTVRGAEMILEKENIDIMLLDIQLPDNSGIDLLAYCNKMKKKPIVILCSHYWMNQYRNVYNNLSVDYFFDKYYQFEELKQLIKNIARNTHQDTQRINQYYKESKRRIL